MVSFSMRQQNSEKSLDAEQCQLWEIERKVEQEGISLPLLLVLNRI